MTSLCLITTGLTELRYLVPFSRVVHRVRPDIEQRVQLSRLCSKHHGYAHGANVTLLRDILGAHCPYASLEEFDPRSKPDFSVTVEMPSEMHPGAGKRLVIGHGFDCNWHRPGVPDTVDAYIATRLVADHMASQGSPLNVVVPPHPIIGWAGACDVPDTGHVLLFHPDVGDSDAAAQLHDALVCDGQQVCVKYRAKHPPPPPKIPHVSDTNWYPADGVSLALSARAVVGFGTTAYADLVELGVRFINIDLHSKQHPWSGFSHPTAENYARLASLDEEDIDAVVALCAMATRVQVPINGDKVAQFMVGLLEHEGDDQAAARLQGGDGHRQGPEHPATGEVLPPSG